MDTIRADRVRLHRVHGYILREFLLSFLVAFLFFFFIFFINQILLYAQKILLKQVPVSQMLTLVALSMPQILLYTIPFSTLSGSSMVIGNLSSNFEIIALRAIGVSLSQMFRSIIICAALLSLLTFMIAEVVLPTSHLKFRQLYSELLRTLPTMELKPYSVNEVGDIVIVTKEVNDEYLENPVIFTTNASGESLVISAGRGYLELIDTERFIYRLDLQQVSVLSSERSSPSTYSFGRGGEMSYYLDFSDEVEQVRNVTPSQMRTKDLLEKIQVRLEERENALKNAATQKEEIRSQIRALEEEKAGAADQEEIESSIAKLEDRLASLDIQIPVNFYLQYYRAELHKKFALSAAALILTLISFPLSFVNIRHGRLFGFGLSILVAAFYWSLLFVAQTQIIKTSLHPLFLMWAPNMVILLVASVLLFRLRRI